MFSPPGRYSKHPRSGREPLSPRGRFLPPPEPPSGSSGHRRVLPVGPPGIAFVCSVVTRGLSDEEGGCRRRDGCVWWTWAPIALACAPEPPGQALLPSRARGCCQTASPRSQSPSVPAPPGRRPIGRSLLHVAVLERVRPSSFGFWPAGPQGVRRLRTLSQAPGPLHMCPIHTSAFFVP